MNKNKKYIFIGFATLLILIVGLLYLNSSKEKVLPIIIENQQIQTDLNTKTQVEIPIQKDEKKETPQTKPLDENNIKVSLLVVDKRYEVNIKEDSSVFDAMEKMQKENTDNLFNFKYTHNASLGNFITEINGKYGTPGKYWIYYVNNKKASVGVSNYILKDGDIITWSQEGY